MREPYVARLRAPGLPTRWYVLGDFPDRLPDVEYVELNGFGPFRLERDAIAARRRLAEGGPATEAASL